MTHTVFIDLDSHVATASATGTAAPDVPLKHLTKQTLAFAFHSSGTVSAVTGWTEGRVVIKAAPTSDVLLLDTTLAATGSTTSTRYSAEWAAVDCDSAALRTLIGASVEPLDAFAEIQWTADSGTHAVSFPIQIVPTFNLPEDDPPDPTEAASWTWLKARLAAGSNITFTDNDTTQVRTIAASGGGGGGGGSTDWGDIGGTLSDQTDLQTALNNKQPQAAALTTLSSATAAGLALMDDADNAAQRTTLGLGNASTLNVGATAGTVAAGDDSRFTDARTPTAHAASHVTGGSDAIQSATASQNGLATATQITKLDGIESLADVTDAANVGSSIHGATAKTTPVDADTVPLIDSAASNVLKKLSWANIKATLKTYFDALYMLKSIYDPQNAGRISGADGADEELYGGASGGTGGTLSMDGGNASTFMETAFAAGNAGSINTSGGSADGGQFGGSGGSINTSGSPGLSGGSINTTAGGSITSGSGNVNLGNTSGTLQPHALLTQTAAFDALAPTTTKGDLIVHNGTDNVRVAVGGTNGHVLTVDSAEASGVKWVAASGGGGKVAQFVSTFDATQVTSAVTIPWDDTIPQDSEGAAYTQLDTSITPTNASSTLLIEVEVAAWSSALATVVLCLFKDGTADAMATSTLTLGGASWSGKVILRATIAASSTSSQTFKVRVGRATGTSTIYLNDYSTPYWGGSFKSSMQITEILP